MNDSVKIRCALTSIEELQRELNQVLEQEMLGHSVSDYAIRCGTLSGWLAVTEMRLQGIKNQLLYKPVNPEEL